MVQIADSQDFVTLASVIMLIGEDRQRSVSQRRTFNLSTPNNQEIPLNDALIALEVTSLKNIEEGVLQLIIGQEDKLLTFDVDNKVQRTVKNFKNVATEEGVNAKQLTDINRILVRDYPKLLRLNPKANNDNKQDNKQNKDDKEERIESSRIAINLAKEFCQEFFIDNLGQPYAAIKVGEHIEVVPIKTSKFKNWLSKLYYDVTSVQAKVKQDTIITNGSSSNDKPSLFEEGGDVLSTEALSKSLRVLIGKAEFSGKTRKQLYLRTARTPDGTIYYDLTNPKWQCVKITHEGWSVVSSPPIFRRYSHQMEQDAPDAIYPIDIFDNFLTLLNIDQNSDNKLLFKCYIIALFYYGIVHAALMLHGEGGSAKTSLQELVRMLVDPSSILTLSISFDIESMAQKIAHNYVCYFDNITKITDTISDLLCRAITGSGFLKRELFTDDEDIIYQLKHCIGITGINLAATKSDLIDRGLIVEHKPFAKKGKKRSKIIWDKFYEIRPKLLAYIFDILVKVLQFERNHPEGLQLEEYPRLADFAETCEIISRCMGNEPSAFIKAFERNISLKHRTAIEDSLVGKAIKIFVNKRENKNWEGTMTDLLLKLNGIAFNDLQITNIKNGKLWPQTSSVLSRRINEIKADLRALGILIESISIDTSDKQISIKFEHQNNSLKTPPCVTGSSRMPIEPNADCDKTTNSNRLIESIDNLAQPITHTLKNNENLTNTKVAQILGTYVAFDSEWNPETNVIEAASFVDSYGNAEVKFREHHFNGSESELLKWIMGKILNYEWSIGWNTQGHSNNAGSVKTSDLSILYERCKANGRNCIVSLGSKGVPYLGNGIKHIDLCNVYGKPIVKNGMYDLPSLKLDNVSKALLGHGKYKDFSGKDFQLLGIEDQVKYSLMDSVLAMELSMYNNFEVLDAMLAISEIAELDFEYVCRTWLSTWWGKIFDNMIQKGECKPLAKISFEFKGRYKGAEVLIPNKGFYHNIVVIDAKSLYPSIGINYNISSDTINCECCASNPKAKIGFLIPSSEFTKDFKYIDSNKDWICQLKTGAFPAKLKIFKAERLKQKELGNKSKQYALKILINGGYGIHGFKDYAYYDPRVAELITATGRYILCKMADVANKDFNFKIIYGDTDSLFLSETTDKSLADFQTKFNKEYDIELEVKNRYDKLLLSEGQKHYIGYEDGVIDIVGYEGEKSDRPELYHTVFNQLVNDILKTDVVVDPLPNLRKVMSDLDTNQINPDLLKISQVVGKDKYNQSSRIGKIAEALGAKKGDTIEYFNANEKKTGKSWTINPTEIDIQHTKQLLWNTIDEVLEISGYPIEQLATEFGCVIPTKKGDKAYLQEVSLGDANAKGGGS
jgi:DNA polymerase elongation subunit (family B)